MRPPDGSLDGSLDGFLDGFLAEYEPELVQVRRQIHAHPELGRAEHATTALLRGRLEAAGLEPRLLPSGTGLLVDLGGDKADGPVVALRADLDALPIADEKEVPYRSTVPGVCHACGHDVHTTVLLGAGLALHRLAGEWSLPGRLRLIFQPAEELLPGGALDVMATGAMDGVSSIYALHCDPGVEVGRLAVRAGAITAASDTVEVRLSGPGGHTARPHLTADLVYALADVVTRVPAVLSRKVDPRAGLSVVWGQVHAGTANNVIPRSGFAAGTVRVLDRAEWRQAADVVAAVIREVAAPHDVQVAIDYVRGVPPVVNVAECAAVFSRAGAAVLGDHAVVSTTQSLGGEDFAWYLEHVPGALARLGVRRPGEQAQLDLHRGSFDVDERAIGCGVRVLVATAVEALRAAGA